MDKKTTGIIVTVATALLCGCCSLFTCLMGIGTLAGSGTYTLGDATEAMPPAFGYVFLCLSFIMILIPVAVGFFMLRKKPEDLANEPLPPVA